MAVSKGIAFPTCVSVNECVTNNSPLESEASKHVRGFEMRRRRCHHAIIPGRGDHLRESKEGSPDKVPRRNKFKHAACRTTLLGSLFFGRTFCSLVYTYEYRMSSYVVFLAFRGGGRNITGWTFVVLEMVCTQPSRHPLLAHSPRFPTQVPRNAARGRGGRERGSREGPRGEQRPSASPLAQKIKRGTVLSRSPFCHALCGEALGLERSRGACPAGF